MQLLQENSDHKLSKWANSSSLGIQGLVTKTTSLFKLSTRIKMHTQSYLHANNYLDFIQQRFKCTGLWSNERWKNSLVGKKLGSWKLCNKPVTKQNKIMSTAFILHILSKYYHRCIPLFQIPAFSLCAVGCGRWQSRIANEIFNSHNVTVFYPSFRSTWWHAFRKVFDITFYI